MSKILDRNGLGAAINATQNDSNLDSLSGIVEVVAGTTYTVTIDDQNRALEFTSGSAVAVTLTDLATILAALHTTSFKVTLKAVGAGVVTITRGSTDTFDDASTTQVLNQYDAITIQSDSTGAKWNVFNHPKYRTAATAGTVDASKAIVADSNKDTTGHRNISATGLVAAGTLRGTIVDANANEVIIPGSVASAVNEITITNAATGNDPSIAATGGDTNIDLVLSGKGSGTVLASTATITTLAATTANITTANITTANAARVYGLTVSAGSTVIKRCVSNNTSPLSLNAFLAVDNYQNRFSDTEFSQVNIGTSLATGTIRVNYTMTGSGTVAHTRICVNGVSVYTQDNSGGGAANYSADITVVPGDVIVLQFYTNVADQPGYCRNIYVTASNYGVYLA